METTRFPELVRDKKEQYAAPELVELGDVAELTQTISVIVNGG